MSKGCALFYSELTAILDLMLFSEPLSFSLLVYHNISVVAKWNSHCQKILDIYPTVYSLLTICDLVFIWVFCLLVEVACKEV